MAPSCVFMLFMFLYIYSCNNSVWNYQLQLVPCSVTTVILDATAILHYLCILNLFISIQDFLHGLWKNIQEVVYFKKTFT